MNEQVQEIDNAAPLETSTEREAVRAARELVPVTASGVQITDLAQQVDYAQTMAKATLAVPKHLRGKVGDCLAIIDISSRAGLSPYMVANHTYLQNDKLCFESQLYHAFLQASGLLKGEVSARWEGTGGDKVCIITGTLKVAPNEPKECRSLPLKDRHPGYVLKKSYDDNSTSKQYLTYAQGEAMKADGKIPEGSKLFSQGSPLWASKVDLAQFYDTLRDWVRMWAPRATMGIYTVDELQDFEDDMKDVTPPTSGLKERLTSGDVSREEGHGAGGDARAAMDAARAGEGASDGGKAGKTRSRKKDKGAESLPKNPKQWDAYARKKIADGTDPDQLQEWWRGDIALRNDCGVTEEFRKPVQAELDRRCKELRPE